MGNSSFIFAGDERNHKPLSILKITVPSRAYTQKDQKAIYNFIKEQVGDCYLPILVPENVKLEIISE